MSTESVQLAYTGHSAFVSALAQALRAEGLEVSYDPPVERRGLGADDVQRIVVAVNAAEVTAATKATIKAVVAKFREQFPGTEVEDDHREGDGYL